MRGDSLKSNITVSIDNNIKQQLKELGINQSGLINELLAKYMESDISKENFSPAEVDITKQNDVSELPKCELVDVKKNGPVLIISLIREDVFNALNPKLIEELTGVLEWSSFNSVAQRNLSADSNGIEYFRVIVLKGLGKHFCAGADINWMRDSGAQSLEENIEDANRLDRLFYNLWSHPCFTISLVHGVALGGGAGLVSCIDHVVAVEGARIAMSEIKLGILPAVIGPYVYRKIGSAQFRRLAMLGSRIETLEAQRIGLVDDIVKNNSDADDLIQKIIGEVLTSAPNGVYKAKQLTLTLDRWNESDEKLRGYTVELTSNMRGGVEGQEGLSSFIDRRKPDWIPES